MTPNSPTPTAPVKRQVIESGVAKRPGPTIDTAKKVATKPKKAPISKKTALKTAKKPTITKAKAQPQILAKQVAQSPTKKPVTKAVAEKVVSKKPVKLEQSTR